VSEDESEGLAFFNLFGFVFYLLAVHFSRPTTKTKAPFSIGMSNTAVLHATFLRSPILGVFVPCLLSTSVPGGPTDDSRPQPSPQPQRPGIGRRRTERGDRRVGHPALLSPSTGEVRQQTAMVGIMPGRSRCPRFQVRAGEGCADQPPTIPPAVFFAVRMPHEATIGQW